VLTPESGGKSTSSIIPGFGYHDVIIETHRHDGDLATLAPSEATAIVRTYVSRYLELISRPGISSVVVFRNHGPRAGASLVHPHSQVIALGQPSPRLAATTSWAHAVYSHTGRCPTCAEVESELSQGLRIVEATTSFVLLVPFAASSPYELCIVPRRHAASFGRIDDAEIVDLAALLQRSLSRLNGVLGRPEFRFAIESGGEDKRHEAYNHWRLRIVPQVVIEGGFELGSGLPINPSRPEDDARALREVLTKEGA
jgi:UDPglucose--hexose-1-phosphate uridylyltransferase